MYIGHLSELMFVTLCSVCNFVLCALMCVCTRIHAVYMKMCMMTYLSLLVNIGFNLISSSTCSLSLSISLFVAVCLSVRLFNYLSVLLTFCLSVCLSAFIHPSISCTAYLVIGYNMLWRQFVHSRTHYQL